MINPAFEEDSDESANYLNNDDSTVSSVDSSGLSCNSTANAATPSPVPIEPVLKSLQPPPISIDRRLFLTADFYPINHHRTSSHSISYDGINSVPENIFKKKTVWSKVTESAKQMMPWNKANKSSSKGATQDDSSSSCSPCSLLFTVFPILKWLSNYSVRDDLLYDLITGFTILALHIPQGLAYGRLAGAEPINGLYVSFFPVIIYAIFGGSRQISIGTFAVISIACRDVIEQVLASGDFVDGDKDLGNETLSGNGTSNLGTYLFQVVGQMSASEETVKLSVTAVEILTSLCLLVGIIQFIIGFLRLGILATLLSDPIISAFCVAAAIHVFTSQIFSLVGVDSTVGDNEHKIPFEVVRSWYRMFSRIGTANLPTVGISAITITCLYSCKTYLEPYLMRRFQLKSIAIPIDILSIVILTLLSYALDLNGNHQVALIPKITAGFDGLPVVPRFDLWPRLFTSAILLAFICYASTYSLEKMYARKHGYEVYPNQELFALGLANIFSSFFLCYPCAGSLARSAVQDKVGGRTQLASLLSSLLICIFILFLSKFLETLPKCALACIIVVALISSLRKFSELFHYWAISKLDGIVWATTFTLVTFLGVDKGLIFGLVIGLAMMILRLAIPEMNLKYHVSNSECYLADLEENSITKSRSSPTPGLIIFEFHGPLLFINVERFKKRFAELVTAKIHQQIRENEVLNEGFTLYPSPRDDTGPAKLVSVINLSASGLTLPASLSCQPQAPRTEPPAHTVVFDMSSVPYIDGKAVECLLEMQSELAAIEPVPRRVRLFLASASPPVLDTLLRCQFFSKFDPKRVFLTVHDAVISASGHFASHHELESKGAS